MVEYIICMTVVRSGKFFRNLQQEIDLVLFNEFFHCKIFKLNLRMMNLMSFCKILAS